MAPKKAPPSIPVPQALQITFRHLSEAALELNKTSDQLASPIQVCEDALKKLNVGVSAWVELASGPDVPTSDQWWDRGLGYTHLKDRWAIALRVRNGVHFETDISETVWAFNDAPRWLRLAAIPYLPALFEALLKQVREMNGSVAKRAAEASQYAEAITRVANGTAFEDWRDKFKAGMQKAGLDFCADAIADSKVELLPDGLLITAPKLYQLDLGKDEITTVLKALGCDDIPFRIIFTDVPVTPLESK